MEANEFERALDALLSDSLEEVIAREQSLFRELASSADGLAIYGAGNLGRKTLAGLRALGHEPLAFLDANPARHGEVIDGCCVLSPEEGATRFGATAAVVIAVWSPGQACRHETIARKLEALGCRTVVPFIPLFWSAASQFLPHFRIDSPHKAKLAEAQIRTAFALMADAQSQATFVEQLRWETACTVNALEVRDGASRYNEVAYCTFAEDEVFVDCGAFDGDTIQAFIDQRQGRFARIIGLEPDPASWEKLSRYVSGLPQDLRERTEIHAIASGARRETLRFECAGVGSHASAGGSIEVQAAPLDELLANRSVSYIKMDIEGAEIDAIRGAQLTIERDRPIVAACIYHLQQHLWEIPLLLSSLFDGYRFFMRRYADEFGDVVCYAVPPERLMPGASTLIERKP